MTYCAEGVFRHADQNGRGGILREGWAQHTTVGRGMYHSEINDSPAEPMRFIQMWFFPDVPGLRPSVEQKKVNKADRTNVLFPIVSNSLPGALRIHQDAAVYSSFLQKDRVAELAMTEGRGGYLYVLKGGPVAVNGKKVDTLGAAAITQEPALLIEALQDAELLLVDVPMNNI